MLNFEFVGNIETLRSVRYIAPNHVGAGIALLLSRWNSYRQKQGTFDEVQMLGERCRLDAMGNARKNLLVGQVFDAISDGEKLVRSDDGLFVRGFILVGPFWRP